jgi:hypothetical protein
VRHPATIKTGMLLFWVAVAAPPTLPAQIATPPLPTWAAGRLGGTEQRSWTWDGGGRTLPLDARATRSHTKTGLLVGGLIGAAATTVFLVGFCSDPDTACGADEVGRAVLFIAVPCTAVGALIGSVVHSDE